MAAPPPPRRPPGPPAVESSSDESYTDSSSDGPQNSRRGPPPGIPARTPNLPPPPIPNRPGMSPGGASRGLPPLPPGGGQRASRNRKSRNTKQGPGGVPPIGGDADDEYDSYYSYDYDSYYNYDDDDYQYEYEYEYDDEYEYEYEYEDEDDDNVAGPGSVHGIAYKKSPGRQMVGLSADMLSTAKSGLNTPVPSDAPKISSGGNRPFGLTSAKLQGLRGGLERVDKKFDREPAMQQDFRGNLVRNTNYQKSGPKAPEKPEWMNKQLNPGGRPMTTNLPQVDTDGIRARLAAAKDKQQQRSNNQPKFMNGLPVGRTSVRRVRQRVSARVKKAPANGRVSAKIALNRKQDPSNPNKFLTKNRVSYRVRKPGAEKQRVSARVSKRVSKRSSKNVDGDGLRRISRRPRDPNRVSRRAGPRDPNRVSRRAGPKDPNRVSRRGPKDPNRVSRRAGPRDPNRVSRRAGPRDPNRVSRRKRPTGNRTSVNQGIFAAKTKAADVPGIGKGDGCYLRFDAANGGVLFAQWTTSGVEDSAALAFFKPETPVPRFNYRRNQGRVDLMTGTKADQQKFCEAWTYFFALAKEYNGSLNVLGQGKQDEFRVDFISLSPQGEVKAVGLNETIRIGTLECIAVLPFGCNSFEGVEKVSYSFFITNANRDGHAIKLT